MTAAEARKQRWESLKDKPLKEKLKYIFTYYWPGIFGGVCVLIFLVSWIGGILTQNETYLHGQVLDAVPIQSYEGNLVQDFITLRQVNTNNYDVLLREVAGATDTTAATLLSAQILASEVDFIVAAEEIFLGYIVEFADLRNVMTAEQLEEYKNYLIYAEKSAIDQLADAAFWGEGAPDPELSSSTEGMTEPIPIAIRLPETCKIRQAYAFSSDIVYFGIPNTVPHIENTIAFLDYIFS